MAEREQNEFASRLQGAAHTAAAYESPALHAQVLAVVPLALLRARACGAVLGSLLQARDAPKPSSPAPTSFHDALVVQLLRWFKSDFFTWVNAPPCDGCGGATEGVGMRPPSDEERSHGAGRVESFVCCASCGSAETRFPRYNAVSKLLQTRRGRCGEWANAFTAVCRALRLRARYVLDWSDHVWTEVWSPTLRRWVHCDSCEAAWDTPLLYEEGWGKKLAYVIAFSAEGGAVDVTPRYVLSWDEALTRRTLVREDWLQRATAASAAQALSMRPPRLREAAALRQRVEQDELATLRARRSAPPPAAQLPGRQSGSVEWRAARGELGGSAAERQRRVAVRMAAALAEVLLSVQAASARR